MRSIIYTLCYPHFSGMLHNIAVITYWGLFVPLSLERTTHSSAQHTHTHIHSHFLWCHFSIILHTFAHSFQTFYIYLFGSVRFNSSICSISFIPARYNIVRWQIFWLHTSRMFALLHSILHLAAIVCSSYFFLCFSIVWVFFFCSIQIFVLLHFRQPFATLVLYYMHGINKCVFV